MISGQNRDTFEMIYHMLVSELNVILCLFSSSDKNLLESDLKTCPLMIITFQGPLATGNFSVIPKYRSNYYATLHMDVTGGTLQNHGAAGPARPDSDRFEIFGQSSGFEWRQVYHCYDNPPKNETAFSNLLFQLSCFYQGLPWCCASILA